MLAATQAPLWKGCLTHSKLSSSVRLLSIKFDYNMPQQCYNGVVQLMKEIMPRENLMPSNFYRTKRMVLKLGLGYQKLTVVLRGACYIITTMLISNNARFVMLHDMFIGQVAKGIRMLLENRYGICL